MDYTIDILLPTYNSQKYIRQQLDSLLGQSFESWHLIVRDDISTDATMQILEEYIEKYGSKISILKSDRNIGVVKSFEILLENSRANYTMLCDHDDVWNSNKIEKTFQEMRAVENVNTEIPVLVHTDLTIVNDDLNIVHPSFRKYSRINSNKLLNFNYLAVANAVTGCTIMINKAAKMRCLPFLPELQMHDWGMALAISKYGVIAYVDEPLMLYRQHENNQVGANTINGFGDFIISKLSNISNIYQLNKRQYILAQHYGFGSVFKYMLYKLKYFIFTRLSNK